MGFIDNIKKKFQESVNKMAQPQPVQQQMSTADRFKQFLNSNNAVSNIIRSNPVLSKRANERISYLQEQPKEQQTATQNITGAERTVNLPTKAVGTTANNQSTQVSVKFDEKKARETFKKANPKATEEEINQAVERLKANNGKKNLPVQRASTTEEVKEAQNEEVDKQVKDIEAENKNTLSNQLKGIKDTYNKIKEVPITRKSSKRT